MTTQPQATTSHPAGLYVLFFTELWERYSFYALMAILTLYMDEALHFPQATSAQVYGVFLAGVYFMPLVGGFVADRWLGFSRAVILGAVLMGFGQLSLSMGGTTAFFLGLALVASGTGMLKPNISTIVGNLYRDRRELSDAAFNIFYMGINTGAFVAPMIVAWLRNHYGWGAAFMSAAIAMVLAIGTFIGFRRHLPTDDTKADRQATADAGGSSDDRSRIVALLVVFAIVVVFWVAFYQNGFTMTLWARDNTDTTISPEVFQSVNPLGIILFSPVLVGLWAALRRRNAEPSTPAKIVIGMILTALTFGIMAAAGMMGGDTGKVSASWLVSAYLAIALGEICVSPMGLSLVTKVAPPKHRATMMGAWFAATATGGYLAGFLGRYWGQMAHSQFFLMVAGLCVLAAVVMAIASKGLGKVFAAATK
ncbi:MAG: peptide MFS transporter [Acidobacteriota bacterium]